MVTLLSAAILTAPLAGPVHGDLSCITSANAASLAKRASPLDSVTFRVGATTVKVCYGRPSSRGRVMIGGRHVPYGRLWRTGANEPTMIHTDGPLRVAGITLAAGTYSLYTIPGKSEWTVIVNRSIEQWGDEGSYEQVADKEVGRAKVRATKPAEPIEQFTIRYEEHGPRGNLVLEWEHAHVPIAVSGG